MLNSLKAGSSVHSGKYRPDIDGLRAIAVSAVVVSHAFPEALPGGFVGVDIFFVISGYLISSILMKDLNRGAFSIWNFYNRRIKRIFPALIVVLLFTLLFGWFCLFRPEYLALGRHIGASAFFSENFLLWSESSYFDVSSQLKPTLHLWSLAIEEQFYIFWPMLLYLAYRRRIDFAWGLILLASISFAVNLHDVHVNPTAAYYSPLGRSWELMLGSLLAYIQANRAEWLMHYKNARSSAGFLLIVLALACVRPNNEFPGFWALLPTVGASLLISGGDEAWVNRRLLSRAPMVWCGLISYPLYLWHWPFLSFSHIIFGQLSMAKASACVVAAVIAAAGTFIFIERPFRLHGKSGNGSPFPGSSRPSLPGMDFRAGLLSGVMFATLACAVLVAARAIPPRLDNIDAPSLTEWAFLKDRTPNFNQNATGLYPLEAERSDLVLFIGDSHIAQYAARLNKVIAADPSRPGAVLAIGGDCIPIEGVTTENPLRAGCWPLRSQAYKMAEESRFKKIVIGGAWNVYFQAEGFVYADGEKRVALTSVEGQEAALNRLGQRIKALIESGKQVVFVLDNPWSSSFNSTGRAIRLSFPTRGLAANSTVEVDMKQVEYKQKLYDWAKSTGASVIDPFDAVCAANVCRTTSETGQPLYKDQGHFNPDWAIENATFIDTAVSR